MKLGEPEDLKLTQYEFLLSLSASRVALGYVLDPARRQRFSRKYGMSEAAAVFRMHELFFSVGWRGLSARLSPSERRAVEIFEAAFDSLPWSPLEPHPHISEVPAERLGELFESAYRLDRLLWWRSSGNLVAIAYRWLRGWPVFPMHHPMP